MNHLGSSKTTMCTLIVLVARAVLLRARAAHAQVTKFRILNVRCPRVVRTGTLVNPIMVVPDQLTYRFATMEASFSIPSNTQVAEATYAATHHPGART